jgi:hypothetical protein
VSSIGLVVAVSLVICAVVFVLMRIAAAVLRRTVAYFVVAVEPPSLIRLTAIVALWLEELHAAEVSKRRRQPPPLPEIVRAFKAFTGHGSGSVLTAASITSRHSPAPRR